MNKVRRNMIEAAIEAAQMLQSDIENIMEEEQEAYDNLPESLQCSERGETMEQALDNLDYALSSLEEMIDYLTEAQGE